MKIKRGSVYKLSDDVGKVGREYDEYVRVVGRVECMEDTVDVKIINGVFRGIHVWVHVTNLEPVPAFKRPERK